MKTTIEELKELAVAYKCALEYDNCPDASEVDDIIDIIDSENSGLSAGQRLDEINRLIKDFNTKKQ